MTPPGRTPVWEPVDRLADLDVTLLPPPRAWAAQRVEIIDRRVWTELVSLAPAEAAALSAVLGEKARQAGWVPFRRVAGVIIDGDDDVPRGQPYGGAGVPGPRRGTRPDRGRPV